MAFTYANGRYPLSMFIHRGDNIYLTPSLNARWNEAVRLALAKYGVRLYITGDVDGLGGWNGYRPYAAQVRYKHHYGRFAAAPGWSSHGGQYGGQEVFAVDVANWRDLGRTESQAWGRFVAIMRLVGLRTNFVTPTELWHVGDFNNPWTAPTFAAPAGTIKPIPVAPADQEDQEDEDDMSKNVMYYTTDDRFKYRVAVTNDTSGLWIEWVSNSQELANKMLEKYDTGNHVPVSRSVFAAVKAAAAAVRPQGQIEVVIGEAD